MLDRVLRGGDWELVKQRNKLKNCQTDYRSKLPDKSSSPEAIKTTVQFSIVHVRNSSRYSQAKLIVRFVVKWREFRGNKKLRQLWSATQDSRKCSKPVENRKNPFFNLFVQIFGRIWAIVGRGYFSHAMQITQRKCSLFSQGKTKIGSCN